MVLSCHQTSFEPNREKCGLIDKNLESLITKFHTCFNDICALRELLQPYKMAEVDVDTDYNEYNYAKRDNLVAVRLVFTKIWQNF